MKMRKIKLRFHDRFAVDYRDRTIWTGKLVRRGKVQWNISKYSAYGNCLYEGKPPTLPD